MSKTVRDIEKDVQYQICRSLNFTSTRSSLFCDIFYGFWDIRVQRISKITPLPKLWGTIGSIIRTREGFWFEANCNIHRNFLSNWSFVGKIFRQTFSHRQTHTHVKLKTTFLDVSVLVESENVLSSTSNFWRYSNTSIRSKNMEVKSCSLDKKKSFAIAALVVM